MSVHKQLKGRPFMLSILSVISAACHTFGKGTIQRLMHRTLRLFESVTSAMAVIIAGCLVVLVALQTLFVVALGDGKRVVFL